MLYCLLPTADCPLALFAVCGRRLGWPLNGNCVSQARTEAACGDSLQVGQGQDLVVQVLVVLSPRLGRQNPGVDPLVGFYLQAGVVVAGQALSQVVAGDGSVA